jgi:hypothetical protein
MPSNLIISVVCGAIGMVDEMKAKREMDELVLRTSGEMGSSIEDDSPESHQNWIDFIRCRASQLVKAQKHVFKSMQKSVLVPDEQLDASQDFEPRTEVAGLDSQDPGDNSCEWNGKMATGKPIRLTALNCYLLLELQQETRKRRNAF